jgi:glucose-1-phosphate adenylyltransferase
LRTAESPNAFISYDRDALTFSEERIQRFALAKLDKNNHLLDIIEKPPVNNIEAFKDLKGKLRVSMNAFSFDGKTIYNYLKDCPINQERDEKELPTALLNMLIDYPNSVKGIPFSEHVPDLTAKNDIVEVKEYLRKYYPSLSWKN